MPVIKTIKDYCLKATDFYIQGIKSMTLGKTLWKIIAVKLFIILFVFKVFFFPDILDKFYKNDSQKAQHVLDVLTSLESDKSLARIQGETTTLTNKYLRR